ncbi:MAG: xanthine dehydrogenase family protein subunit M [Firmicutes bacterium]|nr:xanthine dehydrogenase family protein subunit M [Bacillota bacterium]
MNSFRLINPGSIDELYNQLSERGSAGRIVAGGTDLLPAFKKEKTAVPEFVINLKSISELADINEEETKINVGALATHAEIVESFLIQGKAFVLAEACDKIASWQIRNLATVGGNIANASPAADSVPALLVLDAHLHLGSKNGHRDIKLEKYFTGPGQTVLADGELIEKVSFSALAKDEGAAFVKLGKRKAVTLSIVSAAAYVKLSPDHLVIEDVRLAMGSVAPTPLRIKSAEALLKGSKANQFDRQKLHETVRKDIKPIKDVRSTAEYRLEVSAVLIERAVKLAVERARTAGKGGHQ